MKILLVEADKPTATLLSEALTAQDYMIDLATDGQTGLDLVTARDFDLILLDILLPKLDGLVLCRQLRAQGYQKPILLLTAEDCSADVINGFEAGADDYVTKPCKIPELIARIRVLLRQGETASTPNLLTWGDVQLNPVSAEVVYQSQTLSLTPKEYRLLELFLRNPQRLFDHSAIISQIGSIEESPSAAAVTLLIKSLQQQLQAAGMDTELLETIHGWGYRLKTPPPRATQALKQKNSAMPRSSERRQGLASVNKVLDQFRAAFIERIASLEQAEQALRMNQLSPALRQDACDDAHKLAGGLGMFGYEEGSRLARAIEHLLTGDRPLNPVEVAHLSQQVMELQQQLARPPKSLTTLTKELLLPLKTRLVMVVSNDVTFTASLQAEAVTWGCQVEILAAATAAQEIAQISPDLVLIDQKRESGEALLQTLTERFPALPILVIAAPESLSDRPSGLYGTGSYGTRQKVLQKPISTVQVFEAIMQFPTGDVP